MTKETEPKWWWGEKRRTEHKKTTEAKLGEEFDKKLKAASKATSGGYITSGGLSWPGIGSSSSGISGVSGSFPPLTVTRGSSVHVKGLYTYYPEETPQTRDEQIEAMYTDMAEWMDLKIAQMEDLASREITEEVIKDYAYDGTEYTHIYSNRHDVEGAAYTLETLKAMRREFAQNFGVDGEEVEW